MFDRATRECRMSPTMVTVSPSMCPFSRRTVNRSRRAWVGCSWAPSPALMTGASSTSAIRLGTPATAWRTTTASRSMASRVRAVSRMLSAFVRLELFAAKFTTSADSRLPAISKLVCVRVEGSKNRLTRVRPRRVGTFLTSRSPISPMCSAVCRIRSMSLRSRFSIPSRSLPIMRPPPCSPPETSHRHPRRRARAPARVGPGARRRRRADGRSRPGGSGRSCPRSRA